MALQYHFPFYCDALISGGSIDFEAMLVASRAGGRGITNGCIDIDGAMMTMTMTPRGNALTLGLFLP
jgi:hypothetical protein